MKRINVKALLKKNWQLILIILLSLLMRSYKHTELFMYSHDQDLSAWFVQDILSNRDFRLIGQETSSPGVFIGPLYYYLLIPFYLLFSLNPIGGLYLSMALGVTATLSFYLVFTKIFNKNIGLIASTIHASSFIIFMTEREVVPTVPAFLWTAWFLYAIFQILKGKQKTGFVLSGLLIGLIWNINLAFFILTPLVLISFVLSKKSLKLKPAIAGILSTIISASPLILFELRNNLSQTRAIFSSLSKSEDLAASKLAKLDRVMQLVFKNVDNLLWGNTIPVPNKWALYLLVIILLILIFKKILTRNQTIIVTYWLLIYIIFFTLNSINPSEYYFNGMTIIWILVLSLGLFHLSKFQKKLSITLLALFVVINIHRLLTLPINESGYLQRNQLVAHIKKDSQDHGYPCISVSYITKPGFDMGYRYLFKLQNMHVNKPRSGSPVYTIVFPHSMVDRLDKTFGALGLIYPDYDRYTPEEIKTSCSGENSNLTDPLFGYN